MTPDERIRLIATLTNAYAMVVGGGKRSQATVEMKGPRPDADKLLAEILYHVEKLHG